MSETTNQQFGDGQDNYGQAVGQAAQAAKQISQKAAKQAAVQGAEATANAAAATVQASVEGGKAVAEIAAGTAAGGPWGAILSAAWSLRHTLFEMGYTEEGWFLMRMPMLPPKKDKGSAQYIRGFLYPAMMRFMRNNYENSVRFKQCILIYRHVYSHSYEERKFRDHDNIELNMVTDTVAVRVMADDSPMLCRHYYCSAVGDSERTELCVIPRSDFFKWLEMEDRIPESGLKVADSPSSFAL